MISNRRKYSRIGAQAVPCAVKIGLAESKATVTDESIGGIRIGGLELMILFVDQKIAVEYKGESIVGRCRAISRDLDQRFEVGIYRETETSEYNPVSCLLNSFIRFGGFNLVCIPLHIINERQIRVRLIDGKEFVVGRDDVFQLTRQERMEELADEDRLEQILEVYTAMTRREDLQDPTAILDLEYGPPAKQLVG